MSVFTSIMNEILNMFKSFSFSNLLDILIVAFIIYKAIQFIRETKAGQLFKSLLILIAVYLIALWLDLFMLRTLMQYVFQIGLIAIVIVFQPELRHALEKLGRSRVNIIGRITKVEEEEETKLCIDAVVRACKSMQETKTGALIVFEKETMQGEILNTGTIINALPSSDLLQNIFYPKSPLHDGAVIIRNAHIYAAGCILPLTSNPDISRELGTRHQIIFAGFQCCHDLPGGDDGRIAGVVVDIGQSFIHCLFVHAWQHLDVVAAFGHGVRDKLEVDGRHLRCQQRMTLAHFLSKHHFFRKLFTRELDVVFFTFFHGCLQ